MNNRYNFDLAELIIRIVEVIFTIVIFALFIRFVFRLLGANTESSIVQFVYNSTNPLLSPFRTIFTPQVIEPGYIVEFSTLIAIVFYLVTTWIIVAIVRSFERYTVRDSERVTIVRKKENDI